MNISIGQAAEVIGVSISTLRRWEEEELFKPDFRTKGGHRRYDLSRIEREFLNKSSSEDKRKVVAYARVSSHDQKADLVRQEQRLEKVCTENKYNFELISDLGSGINYNKKGLNKLIKMICNRQVSKLILTHKDRLLSFGSPLLFKLCKFFGTEIDILDTQICDNFEKILVACVLDAGLIEVMTVFTARMHGKRSHKNKRLCAL